MSQVIYSLQITKGEHYLTSNFRFHQLLTVTDETNMPMIPKTYVGKKFSSRSRIKKDMNDSDSYEAKSASWTYMDLNK